MAIVCIEGPIAQRAQAQLCGYLDGYDAIVARLSAALASDEIGAVVLRINSPGGDVAGMDEGVRAMRAAVDASGKPVLAFGDELMASAAYRIASGVATDGIYTPASGRVGSVGVLALHRETSAADAAAGLTQTIVAVPDNKAAGNPTEPLSDVGRARITARVQESAQSFIEAVAVARGMTPAAVFALDGAMFSGTAAFAAGLVDGVASFDEVLDLAAQKAAAFAAMKGSPTMPLPRSVSALLGLSADAPTIAAEQAALKMAPVLALGATVLVLAGGDAAAAEGTVRAWQAAHARLPELLAADEARKAEAEAKKLEAATAERAELVRGAVRAGKLLPAQAWATPGSPEKIASAWAEMKLETLRAFVAASPPIPGVAGAAKVPVTESLGAGHEKDAARFGVSAEAFAAASIQITLAMAAGNSAAPAAEG